MERLALHGLLLDLGAGHRVCIGGIRTDHHHGIGIVEVVDAIGGRTRSVGVLHAKGSRAVAYTRAAIDVVGADHRPHEFLHEVVLLIRTTRTADPRDAVRTVVGLQLRELVGDEVVRGPGGRKS